MLFLFSQGDVKEIKLYGGGNIEVSGENIIGEKYVKKFTFSEYDVKKGDVNEFTNFFGHSITLDSEYYKEFVDAMDSNEVKTIKIR